MIFDFHTHVFPDILAKRAMGKLQGTANISPATDGTYSDLLRRMDEWHIDRAVVLSIATKPKQHTSIFTFSERLMRDHGDRFIPFPSVHPEGADAVETLYKIHAAGMRGVKFHPDYQGLMIDDPIWEPVFETCSALGLVTIFHTGFDPVSPDLIHAPPKACLSVAKRFPDMKMVCAHLGGAGLWDEVYEQLAGQADNLWFDTSIAPGRCDPALARRIIDRQGIDRVLFASDCPWGRDDEGIEYIHALHLGDRAEAQIFCENAETLLGL